MHRESFVLGTGRKAGILMMFLITLMTRDFFDGKIDTIAKTYTFNIPNFVQIYMDDATGIIKPELEIYQPSGTKNVILRANDSKTPVKLEFSYTNY